MISAVRLWPVAALGVGAWGWCAPRQASTEIDTLVLYGNTNGYLAPCGCTSPMSGGIARAATVVRELQGQTDNASFVLVGALVSKAGKQDEMKAECYAETAGALKASAIAFGKEEAALGPGIALEMESLSDNVLVQSNLEAGNANLPAEFIHSGRFDIASVTNRPMLVGQPFAAQTHSEDMAISTLFSQTKRGSIPVLCVDEDELGARVLAQNYPRLGVIVYRSTTDPPAQPIRVGRVLLVTTGYHGKDVVRVSFQNGFFQDYSVVALGPDVADDPVAAGNYSRYLERVNEADLLGKLPRIRTSPYAGSQACKNCHQAAYAIWLGSAHRAAYKDLAVKKHGRDPDCVACHVVGLSSDSGFRDLAKTPGFAGVGCESCHGPSKNHAMAPSKFRLQKIGEKVCLNCHTPDNSPGFDFAPYWSKIKH